MKKSKRLLRALRYPARILACTAALALLLGIGGGSVRLVSPKHGQRISGKISVRADVRGIENLAYLLFAVDQDRPHSTNSAPYHFLLDTAALPNGPHTLAAEAYSRFGLVASSMPITVIVSNSDVQQAPRVITSAPARVASLPAPGQTAVKPAPGSTAVSAVAAQAPVTSAAVVPAASPVASARPAPASGAIAVAVSAPAAPAQPLAAGASFPGVAPIAPAFAAQPAVPSVSAPLFGPDLKLDATMISGRALVLFRPMAQGMEYRVIWLHQQKTAVASHGDSTIEVRAGNDFAIVSGKATPLGTPAVVRNSRLLVPARQCAVAFGAGLQWDEAARTVIVRRPAQAPPTVVASSATDK